MTPIMAIHKEICNTQWTVYTQLRSCIENTVEQRDTQQVGVENTIKLYTIYKYFWYRQLLRVYKMILSFYFVTPYTSNTSIDSIDAWPSMIKSIRVILGRLFRNLEFDLTLEGQSTFILLQYADLQTLNNHHYSSTHLLLLSQSFLDIFFNYID